MGYGNRLRIFAHFSLMLTATLPWVQRAKLLGRQKPGHPAEYGSFPPEVYERSAVQRYKIYL